MFKRLCTCGCNECYACILNRQIWAVSEVAKIMCILKKFIVNGYVVLLILHINVSNITNHLFVIDCDYGDHDDKMLLMSMTDEYIKKVNWMRNRDVI